MKTIKEVGKYNNLSITVIDISEETNQLTYNQITLYDRTIPLY